MMDSLPFDVRVTEVDGGYDVEITTGDLHVAWAKSHDSGIAFKLRDVALPAIGSVKSVEGRTVIVKSREFDLDGHVHIVDEVTGQKVRWASSTPRLKPGA